MNNKNIEIETIIKFNERTIFIFRIKIFEFKIVK